MDVSCLPNARSGTHPDRFRGTRLDIDVDGSAHVLVLVLREGPSRTQGSYVVGSDPAIHKMSSVELEPSLGGVLFFAASPVGVHGNLHDVGVLLMI